ncbi:MAG: hypothetical protein K6A63_05840 [Acholeplasmatales bacterium]|nr:hypothetical protein [Acholeplasmatales bacterium]
MEIRRALTKLHIAMQKDENFPSDPEVKKGILNILGFIGDKLNNEFMGKFAKLCNDKLAKLEPKKKIDFPEKGTMSDYLKLAYENGMPDFFNETTNFFINELDAEQRVDEDIYELNRVNYYVPSIGKHETQSDNSIVYVSESLHKHAYSNENKYKIDKNASDDFSDYVIENYTYNKKEEAELQKLYEPFDENNDFSNLKNSIKVDKPSEDLKKITLSEDAKKKFLDSYSLAENYLNTVEDGDNLGSMNFYLEREYIHNFLTDYDVMDKNDVNGELEQINNCVNNNKTGVGILSALNDKFKDDKIVEKYDYPDHLSMNVIKNPYGLVKLDGLYCVNRIIKELGITKEEFINDPVDALRRYSISTSLAENPKKVVKNNFGDILVTKVEINDTSARIMAGAADFLATLDQKNVNNNLPILANEVALDDKNKSLANEEIDKVKIFSNTLLSDDSTTLGDIFSRNFLVEAINNRKLIPTSAQVMANFKKLKNAIYKKHGILNNLNIIGSNAAKGELEALIAATNYTLNTIKILGYNNPELRAEFEANKDANDFINDYSAYLNNLPIEDTVIKGIKLNTHAYYDKIDSDRDRIYNKAESAELNATAKYDADMATYKQQSDTYADVIANEKNAAIRDIRLKAFNSLSSIIEGKKNDEIIRLISRYNTGKIPLSYLKERIKQIRLNEPVGDLKFNLTDKEKNDFIENNYLIENNLKLAYSDGGKIVDEEFNKNYTDKMLNPKEYETKLLGKNVVISKVKVSEVIKQIDEDIKKLATADQITQTELRLKIRLAKNQLMVGYLAGSKGVALDEKVNALADADAKRRAKKIVDQTRKQAIDELINDIRFENGLPEFKGKDLNASINEAKKLKIDTDSIIKNKDINFDFMGNDEYLDSFYREFKNNANLQNQEIVIYNDLEPDTEVARTFDLSHHLEKVIAMSSSNIKLLMQTETNKERREIFDHFLKNVNDINRYSSKLSNQSSKFFDEKVKDEAHARADLKTNERNAIINKLGEISIHQHDFNNKSSIEFTGKTRENLLDLYKLSTKVDLLSYNRKCGLLRDKLVKLHQDNASYYTDQTEEKLDAYFNSLAEVNKLIEEIKELDQSIKEFAEKAKVQSAGNDLMPSFSMDNVKSNGFVHESIIGSAKLRAQLDIFKAVKRICDENNVNPEDLFGENSKATFDALINTLINKLKDENFVKPDDDLMTVYDKLHTNKPVDYSKNQAYRDIMNLCDFAVTMDSPLNKENNYVAAEFIKAKIKHDITKEFSNVNIKENDPTKSFKALLVHKPGDDMTKQIFNHELNQTTQFYYKDNINSTKVILNANEQQFNLAMLARNYEALKISIINYSKSGATVEEKNANKQSAIIEMNCLTRAFHSAISDYFMAHPEKLADKNLKTFKTYYENPRKFVEDSFKNFAPVNEDLIENLQYDLSITNSTFDSVKENFSNRMQRQLLAMSQAYIKYSGNRGSAFFKQDLIDSINSTRQVLYEEVMMGNIPVSYYNDEIKKYNGDNLDMTTYLNVSTTFTDEQEEEVKRNIYFGYKDAFIERNIPHPVLIGNAKNIDGADAFAEFVNRKVDRKNVHINLNDNNINNINNEEDEKENDLIIDTSSNKNKVHIDLGENNINEPKSPKVEDDKKSKVIEKNAINIE